MHSPYFFLLGILTPKKLCRYKNLRVLKSIFKPTKKNSKFTYSLFAKFLSILFYKNISYKI